jgi:hypothetical protein
MHDANKTSKAKMILPTSILDLPSVGAVACIQTNAIQGAETDAKNDVVRHLRALWVRDGQLADIFCSWDLAYRCVKSGWLKPIVQGKRRTIYRIADVIECMRRIEKGELPPLRATPRTKATR